MSSILLSALFSYCFEACGPKCAVVVNLAFRIVFLLFSSLRLDIRNYRHSCISCCFPHCFEACGLERASVVTLASRICSVCLLPCDGKPSRGSPVRPEVLNPLPLRTACFGLNEETVYMRAGRFAASRVFVLWITRAHHVDVACVRLEHSGLHMHAFWWRFSIIRPRTKR